MISDESYKKGLKKMKEMGRENTMLNQRKISEDMYRLSVGALFGDVWDRPHLTLRERQLITLAANIALARPHGTHTHYRSSHHIGITHEEICEVMMHVGMYGGWPCIAHATEQYLEVLKERGDPMADAKPKRDPIED
ncbi:carboxymuconolactone decarboxylase family protein [Hyphomicrobiales bacterium]|mgnify:FL=1|nr:carboxymuconolactone decarboxylase family protein [Hyphomicrobiales bacterium]